MAIILPFLIFIPLNFSTIQDMHKINFGQEQDGIDWSIINDGVMGGLSSSEVILKPHSILFRGNISLRNNGGFASFKSPFRSTDLSTFERVSIRLRGTGQRLALTLETNKNWFMPYFKKQIIMESDDWQVVTLDLSAFLAYRLGRTNGRSMTDEDLKQVLRIGLITDKKQEGTFELEVDYIEFH